MLYRAVSGYIKIKISMFTLLTILIIFTLLIFFNWVVYNFLKNSFSIQRRSKKILVFGILLILFFSFIATNLLTHYWNNWFTKFLLLISGIYLGFFINFLLFIALAWIMILFFKIFKIKYKFKIIGIIVIILSTILTVYGVINALRISPAYVDVKIKNLPTNWQNKKIIQLSDTHLGNTLGEDYLKKVVKEVNGENPDIVVLTGDLFDGMDGFKIKPFIEIINQIKSPKGIFYVTGNHEGYLGASGIIDALNKGGIKVLNDDIVNIEGLQIMGVNYENGRNNSVEKIKNNSNFNLNEPAILLYHPPTDIGGNNSHASLYLNPQVDFSGAKDLGVDLQLSGHTHKGQIFPFNYITKWIYGGYDYDLHKDGDFQIYISSGAGVWGPTMRTSGKNEIVVINLENK